MLARMPAILHEGKLERAFRTAQGMQASNNVEGPQNQREGAERNKLCTFVACWTDMLPPVLTSLQTHLDTQTSGSLHGRIQIQCLPEVLLHDAAQQSMKVFRQQIRCFH